MTAGYGLTLPLMIANMMAFGLARHLRPTPIYEALLEQDGIELHAKKPIVDAVEGLSIGGVTLGQGPYASFTPGERTPRMLEVAETAGRQDVFPVLDASECLVGIISLGDLAGVAAEPDLEGLVCAADIMRSPVALRPQDLVSRALELMTAMGVRELPVVDDDQHLLGLIDEAAIAHEYIRAHAAGRESAAGATSIT
jgi:CBS domain-containing protein